jgi:hypothetical protein
MTARTKTILKEGPDMAHDQAGFVIITDTASAARLADVRAALEASGIDAEETESLARELAKRHVFSRAKNLLSRQEALASARGVVNKVGEDADRLTYQLDEAYVKKEKLAFEYQGQFWFSKTDETIGADTPELRERAETIFANALDLYTPSDITRLVQRMFTRHRGIQSVRRNGGVYFVPNSQAGLVGQVQEFCKRMRMRWIIYPTNAEGGMKEAVLGRMAERIKSELGAMKAEYEKKGADGMTPRIARARVETFNEQLSQIREFCASLGATADEIENLASTAEVDLGLVKACGSVSTLAALANQGIVGGLLGKVAQKACEDRPRVRLAPDALASLGSDLRAAASRKACVNLAALDALPNLGKAK